MAKLSESARLRKALGGDSTEVVGVGRTSSLREAAMGGQGYTAAGMNSATGGGGESPWTYIKKGGARALDALTVPQAALFTGAAKATGNDVSWRAALGNFGRNAEGESGQEQALRAMGLENKWARLILEVGVDPLWFVAPTKIAKAVKAGKTIQEVAQDAKAVTEVAKGVSSTAVKNAMIRAFSPKPQPPVATPARRVGDAQKSAMIRAFSGKSAEAPPVLSENRRAAMLRAFGPKAANVPAERQGALSAAVEGLDAAADLRVGKAAEYVLRRGRGLTSRRKGVAHGHKVAVPFKPVGEGGRRWAVVPRKTTKNGKIDADAFGAPKAAEKVFDSKDDALRYLAAAAKEAKMARGKAPSPAAIREAMGDVVAPAAGLSAKQKAAFAKAFSGGKPGRILKPSAVTEKVPYAVNKKRANRLAKALGGKRPPRAVNEADPTSVTKEGLAENFATWIKGHREQMSEQVVRPKGTKIGVRFGTRKWGKTISTGIPLREKTLRSRKLKGGFLNFKPVEKVAHRLRNVGAEMTEAIPASMMLLADRYGMTVVNEAGQKAINQGDATMIGVYRAARSVNKYVGDAVEDALRRMELWEPRHSQFVAEMDKRYKLLEVDVPGGYADKFMKKIDEIQEKNQKLHAKLNKADKEMDAGNESRSLAAKRSKILDEIAANERTIQRLRDRGEYTPFGKSQEQLDKELTEFQKDVRLGLERPGSEYTARGDIGLIDERKAFDNPFMTVSLDDFVADLTKAGLDEGAARGLAAVIDVELAARGIEGIGSKVMNQMPEWNAFLLAGRREKAHIWTQVEKQIEDLLEDAGVVKGSDLYESVQRNVRAGALGRLGSTQLGHAMLAITTGLKGWFTTVNPAHFTTNFLGDFSNRQVNGTFRHLAPLDAAPKNKFWELANAMSRPGEINVNALQETWDIGGRKMTGMEVLMLSRMSGLGRGYVGTDIAIMADAFEHAGKGPKEWYRWAQRMNIKRENAQRLGTWVRHMQAGEDPIEAMVKTLRVHFDYTELTDFEKLVMRNVLLFYTWLKRNTMLQTSGIVTRPGLYSAWADAENHREKYVNEPGYFSEMGMLPSPFGNISFAAPVADLRHLEVSWDNVRKTVFGAGHPFIRVPIEVATNTKMFTGGRIQDYEGEITPSVFAKVLSMAGVPLDHTSVKAGGEKSPGLDPIVTYMLSQVAGPQLSTAQTALSPDQEQDLKQFILGRVAGVRIPQEEPVKWKRSADYIKRKKKADETRRRNAQEVH